METLDDDSVAGIGGVLKLYISTLGCQTQSSLSKISSIMLDSKSLNGRDRKARNLNDHQRLALDVLARTLDETIILSIGV